MSAHARRLPPAVRPPSLVRFLAVAVLVPVLLLAILLWLRSETVRAETLRNEVTASFQRRIDLITLLSRLKDAETAQRGYMITRNRMFLGPYEPARRDIDAMIAQIRGHQQSTMPPAYFDRIARLAEAKLAELDRTIAVMQAGRSYAAQAIVATGRGRRYMDTLRAMIGAEVAREGRRLADRQAAFQDQRGEIVTSVVIVFLLFSVALLVFLAALWRFRSERYQARLAALEAAERNAAILGATVDAIMIVDPVGRIEQMNAAATRMLGYAAGDLDGRALSEIIDIAPGEESLHQRIGLADGRLARSFLADRTVRHCDGHLIPVDVAIGVMTQGGGDHLVVSLRDVSERRRVDRMKDELMSTVSHELRTPLTSVIGALGLLHSGAAGDLTEDGARLVDIADTNSRRLIRLINDMLDIDRIESGRLHIARDRLDLRTVVARATRGSEGLARAQGVIIDSNVPNHPIAVSGDTDRLVQVIGNLLSNAIRVSAAGDHVAVSISVYDARDVIVRVADRGPGIPPAFRDRIFGRFERVDDDRSTGTGLGLAISREIVARHDGRIWFEDRDGGGTNFCFSLPLVRDVAVRDAERPRVLVCQQDPCVADSLCALVEDLGGVAHIAADAGQGREALARNRYAAVLVDLDLPDIGGLAFARAAREGADARDVPILIVATTARPGGDPPPPIDVIDWIGKPVDPTRLTQALRAALARPDTKRPVVLHLDDDRDLIEVVATALEAEAEVVSATNLTAARAVLRSRAPDAVILDIRLADGVGSDLLPLLTDADGRAIPTVIYSAQDVSAELAARVDSVLVKARGSIPDLRATLRRIVRMSHDARPDEGGGDVTMLKILYVDDDADIRTIVRLSLSLDPSLAVTIAASGEEGLQQIARDPLPDAVLLDVMMPGLDGPGVLDRLRDDPRTADVPVIFLTARARSGDIDALRARGACGVILKPFDPIHLAADVRAVLERDCALTDAGR